MVGTRRCSPRCGDYEVSSARDWTCSKLGTRPLRTRSSFARRSTRCAQQSPSYARPSPRYAPQLPQTSTAVVASGLPTAIAELDDRQAKHLRLSRTHYDDLGASPEVDRAAAARLRGDLREPAAADQRSDRHLQRGRAPPRPGDRVGSCADLRPLGGRGRRRRLHRRHRGADASSWAMPRIRFVNLPFRTVHPSDPRPLAGLRRGALEPRRELCTGTWIAPLDDDDELLPDHMETLLELALSRRAEYVVRQARESRSPRNDHLPVLVSARDRTASACKPRSTSARWRSSNATRYSWAIDEPTDWNVIRRMRDAGVLMAATETARRPVLPLDAESGALTWPSTRGDASRCAEGQDGIDDVVDLRIGQVRAHRQAQQLRRARRRGRRAAAATAGRDRPAGGTGARVVDRSRDRAARRGAEPARRGRGHEPRRGGRRASPTAPRRQPQPVEP